MRHALGYRSYRVATLLISFIFYVNHWIFTWHYLEAAALFKLTFGQHGATTLTLIEDKKKRLKLYCVVGLTFLLIVYAFLTYFCFNADSFHLNFYGTTYTINAIFMIVLTVTALFAMSYI